MLPVEFTSFVRKRPFRAYRIRLTDGRYHDIVHPDMAVILGFDSVIVGIKDKKTGGSQEEILISLAQVTQIEFIDAS